jgi:hypothetical protein
VFLDSFMTTQRHVEGNRWNEFFDNLIILIHRIFMGFMIFLKGVLVKFLIQESSIDKGVNVPCEDCVI